MLMGTVTIEMVKSLSVKMVTDPSGTIPGRRKQFPVAPGSRSYRHLTHAFFSNILKTLIR